MNFTRLPRPLQGRTPEWRHNPLNVIQFQQVNKCMQNTSGLLTGLVVDRRDGTVYVTDYKRNQISYKRRNQPESITLNGTYRAPSSILIDYRNQLIIIAYEGGVSELRLDVINAAPRLIIAIIKPWGLAIDSEGSVYVTDIAKHRVMKYSRQTDEITIVAGGNGRGGRLDQLDNPVSVAVSPYGSVYVSDNKNHRVVKWEPGATVGNIIAGSGRKGYGATQLNYPEGILLDAYDNLYIADRNNYRVVRYPRNRTIGEVIIPSGHLHKPLAIAFDADRNIYVTDTAGRVLTFQSY